MCYFQSSDSATIAFVFICPGRAEEVAGHPCAGATGKNLAAALHRLNKSRGDVFASADRVDYIIKNAWTKVEFKQRTLRSMPTCLEVAQRSNVERLVSELSRLSLVIACGEQAKLATQLCVQFCKLKTKIVCAGHLSQRAINKLGGTNSERILKWSDHVIRQL